MCYWKGGESCTEIEGTEEKAVGGEGNEIILGTVSAKHQ